MDRGTTISGIGHLGLILWVALGDWLFAPAEVPPIAVANVSMISESDFKALQASAPKPADKPAEPAPEVAAPEPVQPELPPAEPLPEPAAPEPAAPEPVEPAPQPELPAEVPVSENPQPIETPPPVAEIAPVEQPIPTPKADEKPKPRPIDRVAETPVDDVTDTPDIADVPTPEVSDQPEPDAPVVTEDLPPASPEEAAPVIVTEAVETEPDAPQLAPTASIRPQSRPERPTEPVAEPPTETAAVEPLPEEPAPDAEADAIAAALAEAVAEEPATETADAGAPDLPQGPPMSASDIEGIRSALGRCWNIGALSSEATRTVVTVRVSMQENGTPDLGTMQMASFEGGSEESAKKLYQSARSAIARCGNEGFTLPPEKYDQWKDLELVFDPNGMRLR